MNFPVVEMEKLIPRFILKDKNGAALAAAIGVALSGMVETIESGVALLSGDVDSLPEWRLDEIAWERNCVYHKMASIEQKRAWVHEAIENERILGTPQSLQNYLETVFLTVRIEESWEYEGEPYHFRIFVGDVISAPVGISDIDFAGYIVERVKPLRSICDGIEHEA